MAEDEDIAALVIDNGSGMCKGKMMVFVEWWRMIIENASVIVVGRVTDASARVGSYPRFPR